MTQNESKRIGTFADFCKSKHKKTINESSEVSIEVPFWNEAIEDVLGTIHGIAGEPADWERLVNYVKTRFIITGRELIEEKDRLVLAFIIDTLFQNYGSSWVDSGVNYNSSTADLGSKALVLSTLAEEILHKVKQEANIEIEPEPESPDTVAKVYLEDPYDYDDYCGERNVVGYGQFTKLLKESVERITTQDDGQALDYVLNKIKRAAGSLKLEDVLKVVQEEEYEDLEQYVSSLAEERLSDFKVEINGMKIVDKNVIKTARKLFAYQVTMDALEAISKETKGKK